MKKVISLCLAFILAAGIGFSVSFYQVQTSAGTITPEPVNNSTVSLLNGDINDFCAKYNRNDVNKYYTRYSNKFYPAPLEISWDPIFGAKSYEVRFGTKADLTDAKRYATNDTKIEIEDLYTASDYYYQVTTKVDDEITASDIIHVKTADLPRTIDVHSIGNTRDFGGRVTADNKYRVKQGIIFRGENVDDISDEGKSRLLNDFKIRTDMDLRGKSKVSPLGTNIKLVSISAPMYRSGLMYELNYPKLKQEIMTFANPNNFPVYMHCAIGRDRTGTLCFLLGALVGMKEEDICRDYQLSFFAKISNSDVKDPLKYTKDNYMAMLNYMKYYDNGTLQQNTMEYMRECLGIKQADLNKIRANLLTPTPAPIPEPKVATPAKVKLKTVKNIKKKSILVKFKKAKHAVGYQVWCAKKKKTNIAKKKFTTKTKYTFKKLKKKKTYYIKVRAYNINGHIKVYGAFSKTKKVRIRK